jgi:peptidyl-prolyl cis-trans isomerase D
LPIQTSDWIGLVGGEGLLAQPKVVGAAFSDDVLGQGNNSEVVEINDKGAHQAVVVRVIEHQEAAVRPFAEVKDEIVQTLRDEKTRAAVKAEAEALAQRLKIGESLTDVAGQYQPVHADFVGRSDESVPDDILGSAFSLSTAALASRIAVTVLRDGTAAVVVLEEVRDGDASAISQSEKEAEQRSLARNLARAYYDELLNDLQQRADIRLVNKDNRE